MRLICLNLNNRSHRASSEFSHDHNFGRLARADLVFAVLHWGDDKHHPRMFGRNDDRGREFLTNFIRNHASYKKKKMASMNEKVMAMFNRQPVIALATSDKSGLPNVVRMNAKKILPGYALHPSKQSPND